MRKNRIMAAVSAVVMAAACMGTMWSDRVFTSAEETAVESTERNPYKGRVMYGDIDLDGMVTLTDLTYLSLHLLGDGKPCSIISSRIDLVAAGELLGALRLIGGVHHQVPVSVHCC